MGSEILVPEELVEVHPDDVVQWLRDDWMRAQAARPLQPIPPWNEVLGCESA